MQIEASAAPRSRPPLAFVFLALILVGSGTPGAQASPPPQDSSELRFEELEKRPGRGEQCLVSGAPVNEGDVVEIRCNGRIFHVNALAIEDFRADPESFFRQLEARSALFDERSVENAGSPFWMWAGLYVLAGLVGAAICGYVAVAKALSPLPWFFAGLAGNVAAVAVVLAAPRGDASNLPAGIPGGLSKVPLTRIPSQCAACGAPNHPAADSCSACGIQLKASIESEARRVVGAS